MDGIAVVVRAFRGRPLFRTAIYAQGRTVYVANPALLEAVKTGESFPVGFPAYDVFIFKSDIYEKMRTEWDRDGVVSSETWCECQLLVDNFIPTPGLPHQGYVF